MFHRSLLKDFAFHTEYLMRRLWHPLFSILNPVFSSELYQTAVLSLIRQACQYLFYLRYDKDFKDSQTTYAYLLTLGAHHLHRYENLCPISTFISVRSGTLLLVLMFQVMHRFRLLSSYFMSQPRTTFTNQSCNLFRIDRLAAYINCTGLGKSDLSSNAMPFLFTYF